ncbi:MAG: hypothetical protein AAF542_17470 [Pseudomonadota bacterium]
MGSGHEIPASLIRSCLLAEVPANTFHTATPSKAPWFSEYNVAAWLGFRYAISGAIGILLEYTDQEGEHSIVVDECSAPEGLQLMLSGRVQVTAIGRISRMTVRCCGIDNAGSVRVDELFVQRVEESAALLRRAKFASNF